MIKITVEKDGKSFSAEINNWNESNKIVVSDVATFLMYKVSGTAL